MDGHYSLVAGHVEAHETIEEGAIRESKEEAGIGITADQLKFVFLQHRQSDDVVDEYIDVFFEVNEWQGEFTNMEPEKCVSLDWFDIDQLPENTILDIADVLTQYRNEQHYKSRRKVAA
jgi:ADP-ribose pyrophosphatase YjhB (NUDIX family)